VSLETINKRLKIIDDLQEEINRVRALFNESLENVPQFQEVQEKQTVVRKETKEKKEKILEEPAIKGLQTELKGLLSEIKENKEVLSQELAEYYKESGSLQIVDNEGNVKRIKFTARLVND